jgi:hypothetical protein
VRGKLARPVREETDGKGPGQGHLAGGRLHSTGGGWKRSTLATDTKKNRPRETAWCQWLRDLPPGYATAPALDPTHDRLMIFVCFSSLPRNAHVSRCPALASYRSRARRALAPQACARPFRSAPPRRDCGHVLADWPQLDGPLLVTGADNLAYLRRGGGHFSAGIRLSDGTPLVEQVRSRQGRDHQVRDNLRVKEVTVDDTNVRFSICHHPEQAEPQPHTQREDAIARRWLHEQANAHLVEDFLSRSPGGAQCNSASRRGLTAKCSTASSNAGPAAPSTGSGNRCTRPLIISLGRGENEIEFADHRRQPIARGRDESVLCRCPVRARGHRHRLASSST